MPSIPESVKSAPLEGLELLYQGKVRDTYVLPDCPELLLVKASDRISIFDHVLAAIVHRKGAVLTAMNHFWRTRVIRDAFPHDLVVAGAGIDEYLPEALRGDSALQARATVVRKLDMLPIEAIARGYLTGSGWGSYQASQSVCGHHLPTGLSDGAELPWPLFTPTTKAQEGHDEHMDADAVAREFGIHPERAALAIYTLGASYARSRGIILADTKFEFGRFCLGDEVLTPDSSRFWDAAEWGRALAAGKSPSPFDKEYVRVYGKNLGIHKRDPKNPDDVAWVHAQEIPQEILDRTTQLYRYIFWRLTGKKLEYYQHDYMDIDVQPSPVNIEVISGSASDLSQMRAGLNVLEGARRRGLAHARRHVISCHRNPDVLAQYAREVPDDVVIVAGAGLAAALPGVLKALLREAGKGHIPVLGVGFEGSDATSTLAAELSIDCLPGNPIRRGRGGEVFVGKSGFLLACTSALYDEFLPDPVPASKEAELDVELLPPE